MSSLDDFIEKMKREKEGFKEVWEKKRNHRKLILDLISLRLARGFTTKELGIMTGLKQSAISRFENGNNATLDTLFKIATALNCEIVIDIKEEKDQIKETLERR